MSNTPSSKASAEAERFAAQRRTNDTHSIRAGIAALQKDNQLRVIAVDQHAVANL